MVYLAIIILVQVTALLVYVAYEGLYFLLPAAVLLQYVIIRYWHHNHKHTVILGIVALEMLLLIIYILYTHLYYLILNMVIIGYLIFKYWDGDEETGNRAWHKVRRWAFWRRITPVEYVFLNREAVTNNNSKSSKRIFLVIGNVTYLGLLYGFGLHGGVFEGSIFYMVPWLPLSIPGLRDVLLWTGAIVESKDFANRQTVYAPGGWVNLMRGGIVNDVPLDIFDTCRANKMTVVPVLMSGEFERYNIYTRAKRIQQWCVTHLQWPFPFIFGLRLFGGDPPPKLSIHVGTGIEASLYESSEELLRVFTDQINGITALQV